MIIMCWCKFTHCNKLAPVVSDVLSGEALSVWGLAVDTWELSVVSAQFYCKPKIAVKKMKSIKRGKID